MTSRFYEDDQFLATEYELLSITLRSKEQVSNVQARRHINEGFDRRLLMMQSSRIFMREGTKRDEPLDAYFWEELNVHLNAYYLNLRGALDNLAWALQYEFNLLPDVTEDQPRRRSQCNLFGESFMAALARQHRRLSDILSSYSSWEAEIRQLRDPAAHRIPLTAIAGVIADEDQLDEYRRLEALAARPKEELGGLSRSHYLRQAQLVGKYMPLLALSSPQGLEVRKIPDQIALDHENLLTVSSVVLGEIMPGTANTGGAADG